MYAQLSRDGVRAAFVDGDQISLMFPADGTHHLRARNLAAMSANFRQAGAQCLVLSGFVHTRAEVRLYDLVDAEVTLCRLQKLAQTRPGDIVLLHDIHSSSVDAVPGILAALAERGYKFVTVSGLLAGTSVEPGRQYRDRPTA